MSNKSIMQRTDNFTGFQAVIGSDHTYIHEGIAFSISFSLGSISGAYYIGLTTPASGYLHFRPMSTGITSSANSINYAMYEALSYTGGVAYTPFNRNRNSSTVSTATVKTNVTATPGSEIQLDNMVLGTSGNPTARNGGASSGGADEIILKQNTSYVFGFTPGGATTVKFNVFWYEETSG